MLARSLLGQHQLTAREVAPGLREQDRDLHWEHVLPVQVLMQAVVIARGVLQQQWRGATLARVIEALGPTPVEVDEETLRAEAETLRAEIHWKLRDWKKAAIAYVKDASAGSHPAGRLAWMLTPKLAEA